MNKSLNESFGIPAEKDVLVESLEELTEAKKFDVEALGKKMRLSKVGKEVLAAYADAVDAIPADVAGKLRDLHYKSKNPVSGLEFVQLARDVIKSYNSFDGDVAQKVVDIFGKDAEYYPAREGSVGVYVKPKQRVWLNKEDIASQVMADELSFEKDGTFRLWWD